MPKCKYCKESFESIRANQIVCCGLCAYYLQLRQKAKIEKKETKIKKEKLKTYTQKVNGVKDVFQEWVRKRDACLPCISCDSIISIPYWTAGHYKDAGVYRGVIFNELNVNRQCVHCNFHKSGNESNYRKGLVLRIGIEKVEALELLAEQTKKYKYSDDELMFIKQKYKKFEKIS